MKASPTIAALVRERTGCSWSRAKKLCEDGRVTVGGEKMLDPAARVAADAEIAISEEGTRRRAATVLPRESIVHFDRDVVVVEKPPGMLSVEDEPGNKDTLCSTCARCCGGWTRAAATGRSRWCTASTAARAA
jgi:23S rRNA-/tRNA-specific pseudouridylate synthase